MQAAELQEGSSTIALGEDTNPAGRAQGGEAVMKVGSFLHSLGGSPVGCALVSSLTFRVGGSCSVPHNEAGLQHAGEGCLCWVLCLGAAVPAAVPAVSPARLEVPFHLPIYLGWCCC